MSILNDWERLQTSDHYYYMCTKFWNDGDVHKYFSPYDSPYDAYLYFMNAFSDLECRIKEQKKKMKKEILGAIKRPGRGAQKIEARIMKDQKPDLNLLKI
jgi:alpha-amylase/alpha-mannosidase (GH57 family)